MEERNKIIVVAISGFFVVLLGAFGAHGLRDVLEPRMMHAYETGVNYHIYHTLAMGLLVALASKLNAQYAHRSFAFFLGGMLLFSGSLYVIAIAKASSYDVSWIGPVTPIGGVMMMVGWVMFLLAALKA